MKYEARPKPGNHSKALFVSLLALQPYGCSGAAVPQAEDEREDGALVGGEAGESPSGAAGGAPDADSGQGGLGSKAGGGGGAGGADAGSSAGAPGGSGGSGDQAEGGSTPEGKVGVFVAVGWGGRRIASCDDGRTWTGDVQEASEGQDNWHRSYTPKGLAYGNGRFVFLSGWGTPSTTYVSSDGVNWSKQTLDTTYGGLGFKDGKFVLVNGGTMRVSADGESWTEEGRGPGGRVREGQAFDDVVVTGNDGTIQAQFQGRAWSRLSCEGATFGGIGHQGGFIVGQGLFVTIDRDGRWCSHSIMQGTRLGSGQLPGETRGKPAYFAGAFWAGAGDRVFRSSDGKSWTPVATGGASISLVAQSNAGTLVGIDQGGDNFFFSQDEGASWAKATATQGNGLHRLSFGLVDAAQACARR